MRSLYDEDYYERGIETGRSCYSNYRWMPELTIPLAARIIEYLNIGENDKILDFGCAKGYLVKAFRLLHREAYGFDLSEYAISCADEDVKKYVSNEFKGHYEWVIAKDVFEHIEYEKINDWLRRILSVSDNLFAIIPLGDGKKYIVPAYELDETHIIREDVNWWKRTFEKAGYVVVDCCYKVKYIKENWERWDKGNGFFRLKRKIENK